MTQVYIEKDLLSSRILETVENLMKANNLYQERLRKDEVTKLLSNLFEQLSPEEIRAMSDNNLIERIDSILMVEAISGTLDDLTDEQRKIFEEAVAR
jgi:hypothetical protein